MENILKKQKQFFKENETKSYQFRYEQLSKLEQIILKNEDDFLNALSKDLNRDRAESYMAEIHTTLEEIKFYKKNLRKMMKVKRMNHQISTFSSKGYVKKEPKGVTLIISPWNYPFYLTFVPLINNIGAGNCAIVKLSERSKNTSNLIEKLLNESFEDKYIFVLDSNRKNFEAINLNVDHIFFTGSTNVGKIIMKQASENLIPITLELGGKSPGIVGNDCNIKKTVKEILWGKLLNSGQTCIAPDCVYVHEDIYDEFLKEIKVQIKEFKYENRGYIDQEHKQNLLKLLNNNKVILEHNFGDEIFYITENQVDELEKTEIFGMILPLIKYKSEKDIVSKIEYPLATYIFSNNKKVQNYLLNNITCRGFTINGTVLHISNNSLPFGGIKNSGVGQYHGIAGFNELTYTKSVLKKGWFIPPFIYPPYNEKLLKKLLELSRIF